MASSTTPSPAISPSQLCSGKNGMNRCANVAVAKFGKGKGMKVRCMATSMPADRVPDMGKRELMNLLLLGAISLPSVGMLYPYTYFFVPPGARYPNLRRAYVDEILSYRFVHYFYVHPDSVCDLVTENSSGGGSGGTPAKDALGNDVVAEEWLKTHGPGDRTLTQGLRGDPTYLVVENDRTLATYGINAVCTHLGCVVPWNKAENKFMCPCHGSQYNNQGKVVRGPAPLSLALAHADLDDGKVLFVPWVETDFRTGENPWWS